MAVVAQAAPADDLDIIVDHKATAEARGEAYERLAFAEFPKFAAKLATLLATQPVLSGIGPRTKKPWLEIQFGVPDRIQFTVSQLWFLNTEGSTPSGHLVGLMLALIEDPSIGPGRSVAVSDLRIRLHNGKYSADPTVPPLGNILRRLDRSVRDATMPNAIRRSIVAILFEHGDPNHYLDLAIELTSAEGAPGYQAEAFRNCTPMFQSAAFTDANRRRFVRHCYDLLDKIDDGRSGAGYFLAGHVGSFLSITPIREYAGPFAPDSHLPKYQNNRESFFQDTVANARKWWDENKANY
jgi:hypothetical protein